MIKEGPIRHIISVYAFCSTISIYSTLIVVVLKGFDAAFLCLFIDFYLIHDRVFTTVMQIWVLLTRSQCRVVNTLVTVKVRGPLVLNIVNVFSFFLFYFVPNLVEICPVLVLEKKIFKSWQRNSFLLYLRTTFDLVAQYCFCSKFKANVVRKYD